MAIVFGLASIFPLVYMVSLSFQPTSDILTSNAVPLPLAPHDGELHRGVVAEQL